MEGEQAKMGRPLIFKTPEELTASADSYFALCDEQEVTPTVNGLALALGFNSKQSLFNYADRPDFLDAVKTVRTKLEARWEQRLGENACTGAIFWLKNQGWSDTMKQEISGPNGGKVEMDVTLSPDEAYLRMLNG